MLCRLSARRAMKIRIDRNSHKLHGTASAFLFSLTHSLLRSFSLCLFALLSGLFCTRQQAIQKVGLSGSGAPSGAPALARQAHPPVHYATQRHFRCEIDLATATPAAPAWELFSLKHHKLKSYVHCGVRVWMGS